jgi:hypothetical protein
MAEVSADRTLNFAAYQRPLHPKEVVRGMVDMSNFRTAAKLLLGVVIGIYGLIVLMFVAFLISGVIGGLAMLGGLLVALSPVLLFSSSIIVAWRASRWRLRLASFAADNGFAFLRSHGASYYPGTIFKQGASQRFEGLVTGMHRGVAFEFGNFYFDKARDNGRYSHERGFGVIRIRLERQLPHVLLDSKRNNRGIFSNLPSFRGVQRLTLEGDFNNYFGVYVPADYGRDTLYFLTPELMALFIDYSAKYDLEIVDDSLFMYSNKPFSLDKQAAIEHIFHLMQIVGDEVRENTRRYADARIGNRQANIIAEPGRRLKRSRAWFSLIFTLFMIGWLIYSFIK